MDIDKYLKPNRFEIEYTEKKSSSQWNHWRKIFESFLTAIKASDTNKLDLLFNHVSHNIFELIEECKDFKSAIEKLDSLYNKPKNEIYARYCLISRHQQPGESIDEYLQALRILSKDCSFKAVTSENNKNEHIRDAFIKGLLSNSIRQRLLESNTLELDEAHTKARSLESATLYSEAYTSIPSVNPIPPVATLNHKESLPDRPNAHGSSEHLAAIKSSKINCYFCGYQKHPRNLCPAKDAICKLCKKTGHFAKVCQSSKRKIQPTSNAISTNVGDYPSSEASDDNTCCGSFSLPPTHQEYCESSQQQVVAASPDCLSKSVINLKVDGVPADGLVDTGSSQSYVSDNFAKHHSLKQFPTNSKVSMASSSLSTPIKAYCLVKLEVFNNTYKNVKLSVLENCCADVILGHDVLNQHSSVKISFGGEKPALKICSVACAKVKPAALFTHLDPKCKPIAIKSRRYSEEDEQFIQSEIEQMAKDGIIEESSSPWRAQVLVVQGSKRKRLVVDYSQTINKYTMLDAYPVPSIEKIVSEVAKYDTHSTIDLKSAYYQIPIREEDKPYTAFEAGNKLWQFTRIPMGVTNGVATFQRKIDDLVKKEHLKGVHVYLDDVTVSGKGMEEHDRNLNHFIQICQKYNLTINQAKSKYRMKSITLLGYSIENHTLKPDPDRLKPLMNLPIPDNPKSLKRALGMFSYYSKWIPQYSDKIHNLTECKKFPLEQNLVKDFEILKKYVQNSLVVSVENDEPFCVETDASNFAISAILTQNQRPVAFFSRTLSKSERNHSAIEKEAYAIVEALRKWRYYLIGRRFKLVTDQKSVSYMFNTNHNGKIKNEKIIRWRLELSAYNYEIIYRPGKDNQAADAFSRICSTTHTIDKLVALHNTMCHPGVTRMVHWVKSQNLPYSVEEVRRITSSCNICAETKPRFFNNRQNVIIKATAPFERLSIDFKGPLPSETRNKYLLTIVDEYSRYPFAIPCSNLTTSTVVQALDQLFSLFGYPAYIHSDRGSNFMSEELKNYLLSKGIASSRTTPYNPCGNGQVERYNGIVWRTITLALKTKNLMISQWERVLQKSLHSLRSLLCTATNCTPHERMFYHKRRTGSGVTLPSWLTTPGKILMKRQVRQSKYEPLTEEVQLIQANPDYALVRLNDGRETTVNLRHLAPVGSSENFLENTEDQEQDFDKINENESAQLPSRLPSTPLHEEKQTPSTRHETSQQSNNESLIVHEKTPPLLRRSSRLKKSPEYLSNYVPK